MEIFFFAADYAAWHYSQALSDMLEIGGNFLWIIHSTFSIPAKRMYAQASGRFGKFFAGIGCFFTIFVGFIFLMSALIIEAILFFAWILLPLALFLLLVLALRIIFSAS